MEIMAQIFFNLLVFIVVMTIILSLMPNCKIKAIKEFFVAVLPKIPVLNFVRKTKEKEKY